MEDVQMQAAAADASGTNGARDVVEAAAAALASAAAAAASATAAVGGEDADLLRLLTNVGASAVEVAVFIKEGFSAAQVLDPAFDQWIMDFRNAGVRPSYVPLLPSARCV
jgi:hypothetical protein